MPASRLIIDSEASDSSQSDSVPLRLRSRKKAGRRTSFNASSDSDACEALASNRDASFGARLRKR